ncbi:MAG TPA: hypothetical protein VNP94_02700 [Actinomycetota bacterium]|nr:hypothetical protein [Actinomycetota bacterium]
MRDRRQAALVLAMLVIGLPAGIFRLTCVANTCAAVRSDDPGAVPFCSLPGELRRRIAAGFREGRSPDVLAVTDRSVVVGGAGPWSSTGMPLWPALSPGPDTRVPVVFAGTGVRPDAEVPDGTTLDRIAPTVSEVLRFRRPFPDVRSGVPVPGLAGGGVPRLILEVAWRGIGTADLEAAPGDWPFLRSLLDDGAGTLGGEAGSLPVDPAATLTTIGTGGLPSEHGITGTLLRNDRGHLVRAWGPGAPLSIIATLPEDLDEALGQRPLVGLVATDPADRGIVGGRWYVEHDRDVSRIAADTASRLATVEQVLARGFGRDGVPDILAVVSEGPVRALDGELRRIVGAAERASGGSLLVVVAGTGTMRLPDGAAAVPAPRLVERLNEIIGLGGRVVNAATPGGLFLDQDVLTRAGVTGGVAQEALLEVEGPDGAPLVADAFQAFAVSFARYC